MTQGILNSSKVGRYGREERMDEREGKEERIDNRGRDEGEKGGECEVKLNILRE